VGLRAGLIKTITEPTNLIAVQLAVTVAKAARLVLYGTGTGISCSKCIFGIKNL
jgi:hypothetical protein